MAYPSWLLAYYGPLVKTLHPDVVVEGKRAALVRTVDLSRTPEKNFMEFVIIKKGTTRGEPPEYSKQGPPTITEYQEMLAKLRAIEAEGQPEASA